MEAVAAADVAARFEFELPAPRVSFAQRAAEVAGAVAVSVALFAAYLAIGGVL